MQVTRRKLVSIIVPALKRPDLTQRCINSLLNQSLPARDYEVIIVENEAHPSTMLPDPLPLNVRRIELAANFGTTGSINRGVQDSLSEYILLLNNDVELDPEFLGTLTLSLSDRHKYGFATGKLVSAASLQARLDGAGDALLRGGGAFRLGNSDLDVGQFNASMPVLAGCGAATLFRRSVFEAVEGLDEDFFAYLDDVDLALRVQLHGYRGIYIPEAVAFHLGTATLGDSFHRKIAEWMTRNQILLLAKDYPGRVLFRLLPQIIVFQVLWFGKVLRHARLFSYLKGIIQAVRRLPDTLRKRKRLMQRRRITDAEFLHLLRESERQVWHWENTRPATSRSGLLKVYFALFGKS